MVAIAKKDDSNHKKALVMAEEIKERSYNVYCSNLVVQEATTVISKRIGMNAARIFYDNLGSIVGNFVVVDLAIEKKAWNFFLKQTKKGTSFVDCANVVVYKEYKLNKIAAFDGFYKKYATAV